MDIYVFKSILVARYVGAVRPFVPAIAGMARMPLTRYVRISGIACLSWAVVFLLPGWALGQAYDAVAAVAGRLFLVVALLGTLLAGIAITLPLGAWAARVARFETLLGGMASYFAQPGAWAFLGFIVLYKLGDAFAGSLMTPFLLKAMAFGSAEVGVGNRGAACASTWRKSASRGQQPNPICR